MATHVAIVVELTAKKAGHKPTIQHARCVETDRSLPVYCDLGLKCLKNWNEANCHAFIVPYLWPANNRELSPIYCKIWGLSINQFITHHSTEALATMSLLQTEKECLKSVLENVNGWSSPTAQWKRVPESRCRDRETTSSNVNVVRGNRNKTLC